LAKDQPTPRILVVDDVLENRLLVTGLLTQADFAVQEAGNGEQALALFEQWRPDLILMDIRMSVMDGFEATRRIRALPGGDVVKIVALTAGAFKEERAAVLASGCDDILLKPFRAEEIFSMLARHLVLRYRYAAATEDVSAQPAAALGSATMGPLPEELCRELRVAATALDIGETGAVIAKIRTVDVQEAARLQALANDYRFGEMLDLLDSSHQ